ncbi:unnamed protein product [Laminaria digitata]
MLTLHGGATSPAFAQEKKPDELPDKPPVNGLLDQADNISRDVGLIRGLPLKKPLNKGVHDRDELRAKLLEKIGEEYTDEEITNEGKLMERLGLFPPKLDYKGLILDLLTDQIAGFYDPDAKELYIMTGLPEALQRPTMAHEIFHVLQDQHFDILAMQAPFDSKENGDFQIARSALIEGDATALMIDFTLREEGQLPQGDVTTIAQMPLITGGLSVLTLENLTSAQDVLGGAPDGSAPDSPMSRAPNALKESLLFPYLGGLRFVLLAHKQLGSWEEVDAIYANAPVSTEQIIHPERYFAKDYPVLIDFDPTAPLGEGWKEIYRNVFGEFQMHLTLKQQLRLLRKPGAPLITVDISAAVEGWGGDKILAMENADGDVLLTHMSNWDTVQDAGEYYTAINAALARRFHGQSMRVQTTAGHHGESTCYTIGEGEDAERLYVERWGDMVLHIEGVPHTEMPEGEHKDALVFKIRDAAFDSLKRAPFLPEYNRRVKEYEQEKATKAATPPAK